MVMGNATQYCGNSITCNLKDVVTETENYDAVINGITAEIVKFGI